MVENHAVSSNYELNQATTRHSYASSLMIVPIAVRSERSRSSGGVEERAPHGPAGL